jgi:outer membrane protein OmpA-like peptidoglycan-associated protein
MPLDLPVVSIDGAVSIHRARVVMQSDVLFAYDSARLSARAAAQLRMVAGELERRHAHSVTVEGYTDSRGSSTYNARLSRRRADAVRDALGARFAARAVGRGEASPVASNATCAQPARRDPLSLTSMSASLSGRGSCLIAASAFIAEERSGCSCDQASSTGRRRRV